jgi:hypothetical protein
MSMKRALKLQKNRRDCNTGRPRRIMLINHGSQLKKTYQKLKMRFESKQATCKSCKKKVMEESICQRTTMQRVQGRKLTTLQISF